MLPLSLQTRQALSKLGFPVLFLMGCLVVLLGVISPGMVRHVRVAAADYVAPVYGVLTGMREKLDHSIHAMAVFTSMHSRYSRLEKENEELKHWYDVALLLSAENRDLKANLNWIPDKALSFVTGRVITETGGVYNQAVLISVDERHSIKSGNIALDRFGLAGRVTEVGERSARVLLISDNTSRIPVFLEHSRASAIMVGNNSLQPRLTYFSNGHNPVEGERVVTGNNINNLPAGIPIGSVHYVQPNVAEVVPYADLAHLNILRIFDYGLSAITPPEVPGRIVPATKGRSGKPSVFLLSPEEEHKAG
ncbi:rod shape-determining protein MreC [Entomobacter blattae]|uniref:Cell shape-determining protein MreC n=1 Tax=Entomobacter blattae TaxID=2762277 RepID=A0A7H1NUT1_9PROT|nr:rod shape-determining protein MreC [Entomobacter blattae]QNT79541.1 rod shape-determining protein MreC [Entomobacter blattae]